jgi:hypothetical protein
MSRYARLALAIACVVVSVAALLNVFANNDEVLAKAKQVACGDQSCSLTRMDRTPFAQTFELHTTRSAISVRCARSAIFFGEYTCSKS